MTDAPFGLFCPFQLRWLNDRSPLAIGEKSRRIGWTWMEAFSKTSERAGATRETLKQVGDCWYSATDMSAAAEFISYCAEWGSMINAVATCSGEPELVDEENGINAFVMRFENGLKIVAGSSNPKFFRSKGGAADVDEIDFHNDQRAMFKAAHATAMFWGYPLRMWSSVNGAGTFMDTTVQQIQRGTMKGSFHRVTILDAVEDGIVERIIMRKKRLADVPPPDAKARQEWLDEMRGTCPDQETWDQEYMCIRADSGGSLLSYETIDAATLSNLRLVTSLNELPTEGGDLFAGYDVGRKRDLSVLFVFEKVGDVLWTRMLKVLDRASFQAQERLINTLMQNPRVRRICIDEQGIGAQLAENAIRKFNSRAEGVSLSNPVKATLGMTFRDRFHDRQIRIPNYIDWEKFDSTDAINRIINRRNLKEKTARPDWLREDLHKTKRSVTAAGNVRLAAESDEDGHADGFWAGALANEAASDGKPRRRQHVLMEVPLGW